MDDQRTEIRVPPGRVRVVDDAARPVQPGGVSRPARRSRLRPFLWLLLIITVAGAAVWYFPRPENEPKNAGRPQPGAPVPVVASPVEKGDMPVTLTQLGTVTPLAMVTVK